MSTIRLEARSLTAQEIEEIETYSYEFSISWLRNILFLLITGDQNPLHRNKSFAKRFGFKSPIVPGALIASRIASVLGTTFPGYGTIANEMAVKFKRPLYLNVKCKAVLTYVGERRGGFSAFEVKATELQNNKLIATGEIVVLAPAKNDAGKPISIQAA